MGKTSGRIRIIIAKVPEGIKQQIVYKIKEVKYTSLKNMKVITGKEVYSMLPQKPPMVMIDKIIEVTSKKTVTGLTITADNIFCKDGYFQAPGLSENIAQTAAAQAGYLAKKTGVEPPVGFIGAIKKLSIENLPAIGEEIITEIEIMHEIMHFTVISGISKVGDKIMAQCQMNIFMSEEQG